MASGEIWPQQTMRTDDDLGRNVLAQWHFLIRKIMRPYQGIQFVRIGFRLTFNWTSERGKSLIYQTDTLRRNYYFCRCIICPYSVLQID